MSIKRIYFILFLSLCLTVPSFAGIKSISKKTDSSSSTSTTESVSESTSKSTSTSTSKKKTTSKNSKKNKKNTSTKKKEVKEVKEVKDVNKTADNDVKIDDSDIDELIDAELSSTASVDSLKNDNVNIEENVINNIDNNIDNSFNNDFPVVDTNNTVNNDNIKDNSNKIDIYNNMPKKKKIDPKKYYSKAKHAYWLYNITEAQSYLDEILNVEDYQKAYELKNKILLLEEKISFLKKDIINSYTIELKRTLKEANFYEGFLLINKILELNPLENVTYSKSRLVSEEDAVYQVFENKSEQKMFKASVDCFSKGRFTEAKKYIKKISQKYPRFLYYVSVAECYQLEESNKKRLEMFYNKALQAAKTNKVYVAKNYIELAYGLDKYNLKVLILMEQINMELM